MGAAAIVLAGGTSSRFGQDKGLLKLANKPLIKHVLDVVHDLVDQQIIVVNSKAQATSYQSVLGPNIHFAVDLMKIQSPLVGVASGLEHVKHEYTLVLSCDTPFVSRNVLLLLFDLCVGKTAVIPRWPNGYTEPLQAAYYTKPTLKAAKSCLNEGRLDMQALVSKLQRIRFISTLALRQLDLELGTFLNVNDMFDLKKAESLFKKRNS